MNTPPGYREGPAVAYVPCLTSLADYQRNPRVPFPLGYRRCEAVHPGCGIEYTLSQDSRRSVRTFLKRLPEAEVLDAVDVAFGRKPHGGEAAFRYFCGVCWKKIKDGGHDG